MELQQTIEPIAARLDAVLRGKNIPAQYRDWGTKLLDHLLRPVRVVVTGLPDSGKSSLINMMVSRQVLGGTDSMPVLDVTYGPEERVLFELEDGTIHTRNGLFSKVEFPEGAIRAQQELPDPALKGQNYRELQLSQNAEVSKSILTAALNDADIVLWCSNSFGGAEQDLWSMVPDVIKDHSFLIITRADRQMMRGVLTETLETLAPIVNEEFLGMYPVATLQALTALTSGSRKDEALWLSSGGQSLCTEIEHLVESGRAADIDQAQMLLNQCAGEAPVAAKPATSVPQAQAPAPLSARAQPAAPVSGQTAMQPSPNPGAALQDAIQILTASGAELMRDIDGEGGVDTDAVLDRCAETISALSSHLRGTASDDDPTIRQAEENAREGEEMLMLFQLERGEDAALDAVTLLLQMRKELAIRDTA